MSFGIFLIWIGFCIMGHFYFALMEMSLVSANRIKIKHMADKGSHRAKLMQKFLEEPENFISIVMIGENILVVMAASITSYYLGQHFPDRMAAAVSTFIMCPAFLILGEFMPKGFALANPYRIGLWGVVPLRAVYWLFKVPVRWCNRVSQSVKGLLKFPAGKIPYVTREELSILFEDYSPTTRDVDKRKMIREVFEFGEVTVHDLMVPLINTVACPASAKLEEVKKVIWDSGYSRLPIYQDRVDHIIGTVHAIDIIGLDEDLPVTQCMDKPYIVPETMLAVNVLSELQTNRKYMAIVVDEYGGVTGIATLEDLLEEIVGDIHDEYDDELEKQKDQGKDVIIVEGMIELDELKERYGITFPDEDCKTLGGLLTLRCGRIPRRGQWFYIAQAGFEIMEANDRNVVKVCIYRGPQQTKVS